LGNFWVAPRIMAVWMGNTASKEFTKYASKVWNIVHRSFI
jgi:hypothetical protein